MKKLILSLGVLAFCIASCKKEEKVEKDTNATTTKTNTVAMDETVSEQPMDSAAQAKAWEAYATPGEPHKMMAEEVGRWDCEMTFWMAPGAPPEKETSVADIKMILGGRYQEATYKGKMMGRDFEGRATMAYNNASKEITSTFIDNMGTGMMVGMGTYDEATKTTNLKGEMTDPATGKKTQYRETYTFVDENTRKMEMFDTKNGKEYKSMEIVMKRK